MDFLVVAYDIVKDRRRARLQRRLKEWLPRVQKSVFEGPFPESHRARLLAAVAGLIDPRRDTVRVYHLCAACRARTELLGNSPAVPDEPEDVVLE
ncbi:CRISPR-associated endonuclease Cas2 [Myxococcota bacterium]|nr:CRISPR-associated endonuclease Cas2 [Myxococcota bacterium]